MTVGSGRAASRALSLQGVWGISLEVKDAFYILIRLFCKLFFAHVVGFRQGFKNFYYEGALIALSAIWNGSHVWRVGFQNNAVHRNHGREVFTQMTTLEGRDSTDAQHEVVEREEFLGFLLIAGKAMEHAARQVLDRKTHV